MMSSSHAGEENFSPLIDGGICTERAPPVTSSSSSSVRISRLTEERLDSNSLKIFVAGRIDALTAAEFREKISVLTAGASEIIFDFGAVNYISSAGLREILICRKKFPDMRIENVRDSVFNIFSMTGFDRLIAINQIADDAPADKNVLNEFVGVENSSAYVHVSLRKFLRDKAIYSAEEIVGHVAICGANSINWLLTFFAVQKLGAIAVLVNFNLCAREIFALIDYTDVTHFCYGETFASIDELKNFCGDKVQAFYSFRNDVDFKARPAVKGKFHTIVRDDDPAVMIFTSGTTGKLKGVLLSSYNILNAAQGNSRDQTLRADDKACVMLPFFHIFGLVAGIFANALAGSTIYLPENHRSNSILNLIASERCTIFHSVPTIFLALIANKNFSAEKVSSLRCSIISGAHITAAQLENLQRLMPNNHFLSSYGLSEMAPVSITAYDDSRENILHTVGKPVKNIRIKIAAPNQNGVGEIFVQGFNLMTGYYKLAPEEQTIDADGWLHTGDLGALDANGYLRLTGRIKEIIVRGGENIYPAEVEAAISEDENISDVKVLGVPNDFWGEVVCACVKIKSAAFDEKIFRTSLAARLAKFKIPEHFLVYDEFPLLGSGKIDSVALKKNAVERLNAR